jgi:catechol 2,3-dioxygenase-like lactoylglutathione lyase family enzyme
LARHPKARDRVVTIRRLHHAQITIAVGQEAAARNFYCGTLGLSEIDKPASLHDRGGFWLQVGDLQVHVGIEHGADRTATKAHLAYQVDDLDTLRDRLTSAGITILDAIPIPGYDRFEFRDPFGNRVELIQPVLG